MKNTLTEIKNILQGINSGQMKQDDKIRYLEDNKGENTQSEPKTKQINKGIYELYPYKMGNVHFKHFTCLG